MDIPTPEFQVPARESGKNFLIRAAPVPMILLWSTGFIGTKLALYFGEPFTLLFWRCLTAAAFMVAVSLVMRAPWPRDGKTIGFTALVGLLVHGGVLGGSYLAVDHGVSTGIVALVVGLQPVLTAVFAGPLFGERVTRLQAFGLLLGFAGVALVVSNKFAMGTEAFYGVGYAFLSLVGITAGTLVQKRHGPSVDMRTGMAIQFTATAVVMALLASLFENWEAEWTGQAILVHLWLVFALSIGAIALTYLLIRIDPISKVASLFYLTSPVVAVMGYFLFGETLNLYGAIGMAVAIAGVALVLRSPTPKAVMP